MSGVHSHTATASNVKLQKLRSWFLRAPGSGLLSLEKHHLDAVLYQLFGYHLVQLGRITGENLLSNSRIAHKLVIDLYRDEIEDRHEHILADSESLPIEADSVDVVVLPHVLEFESSPHKILRETERILIGEGHAVIVGFNPWSLWGLWQLLLAWRDEPPWSGRYLSLPRLKDWLTLLDFEIVDTEHFYFRPPLKNARLSRWLEFMEKLGRYAWPIFSGVYIIVAKKRVIPLTPMKLSWQERRRMITSGLAEPSARIKHE